MTNIIWIIITFVIYTGAMIFIGGFFYNKSNNISDYFLGGRSLNAWVGALSAQASDMSGWLLMGLPGAVYALGTGQMWIAVGLAIGTMLNWIFVARRLRNYTIKSGDSLTIPEFFENRFRDTSRVIRTASAVFIIIFFAVYTASAFVAGGKLFEQIFQVDYQLALFISVLIILVYTFLGGFQAVCWTDLIQGILMLIAILTVPIIAYISIGGMEGMAVLSPDFLNPMREGASSVSGISIISQLAWGLGYFGMPHILVRFMAIRSDKEVKRSIVIAGVWVVLSLAFAIVTGAVGKAFLPSIASGSEETVFIQMIQKIFLGLNGESALIPLPFLGALFLCGILAAIMSTADSQLLVTASSVTDDIYKGLINKKANDKFLVTFSRITVLIVAIIAYFIAINPNSSVMQLVSNAWAGFGAAFGPLVLLSLYWKRTNRNGAVAGIVTGGLTVIIWEYLPFVASEGTRVTLSVFTKLYSIVPGFIISMICIIAVTLLTKKPSAEIQKEFEEVIG